MLLCAVEHGIGSVWCGAFDENEASDILQLQNKRPVAIVPFGFHNNNTPKRERLPLSDSVTRVYGDYKADERE